jgi:CHAT domain-containing protein
MGVPDVGLEQIAVEVAELATVLPEARVFCGEPATLSRFREFAGSSRLIHLATHALFRADNPLFSGLRFADGWLLARDLYSMRLHCDLVTLSACRTGQALVESGDEMFGLLRGFLAAGARAVAVSLWPAEDLPTASLMTRFHALMAEGQSRTAALRLAQKYVRRTWQHPYQWAAFALFGER